MGKKSKQQEYQDLLNKLLQASTASIPRSSGGRSAGARVTGQLGKMVPGAAKPVPNMNAGMNGIVSAAAKAAADAAWKSNRAGKGQIQTTPKPVSGPRATSGQASGSKTQSKPTLKHWSVPGTKLPIQDGLRASEPIEVARAALGSVGVPALAVRKLDGSQSGASKLGVLRQGTKGPGISRAGITGQSSSMTPRTKLKYDVHTPETWSAEKKRQELDLLIQNQQDHPFTSGILNNTAALIPNSFGANNAYYMKQLGAGQRDYDQIEKTEESSWYKAGVLASEVAQYASVYGAATKALRGAKTAGQATKAISGLLKERLPKLSENAASALAEAILLDATAGVSLDTYKGYQQGLRGTELVKQVGEGAVQNLLVGGMMEAGAAGIRGAKQAFQSRAGAKARGNGSGIGDVLTNPGAPINSSGKMNPASGVKVSERINTLPEAIKRSRETDRVKMKEFANPQKNLRNMIRGDDEAVKKILTKHVHNKMLRNGEQIRMSGKETPLSGKWFTESARIGQNGKTVPRIPREELRQAGNLIQTVLSRAVDRNNLSMKRAGDGIETKIQGISLSDLIERLSGERTAGNRAAVELLEKANYLYSTNKKGGLDNEAPWNYFYLPVQVGKKSPVGVTIGIQDAAGSTRNQLSSFGMKWGRKGDGIGDVLPPGYDGVEAGRLIRAAGGSDYTDRVWQPQNMGEQRRFSQIYKQAVDNGGKVGENGGTQSSYRAEAIFENTLVDGRIPSMETGHQNRIDGLSINDNSVIINNKSIPVSEYKKIRSASVKHPESDILTLGKYEKEIVDGKEVAGPNSYTVRAGETSYFDLGADWEVIKQKYGLEDDEMFELFNRPVLDDAVAAGKAVRFTHKPMLKEYEGSSLEKEWDYIKRQYNYLVLEERGEFWYAE